MSIASSLSAVMISLVLHPSVTSSTLSARSSDAKANGIASANVRDDEDVVASESFSAVDERIITKLQALITDTDYDTQEPQSRGSLLSGALSLGLCFIQRIKRQYPTMAARILVLQVILPF
jgi:hypothetical protein